MAKSENLKVKYVRLTDCIRHRIERLEKHAPLDHKELCRLSRYEAVLEILKEHRVLLTAENIKFTTLERRNVKFDNPLTKATTDEVIDAVEDLDKDILFHHTSKMFRAQRETDIPTSINFFPLEKMFKNYDFTNGQTPIGIMQDACPPRTIYDNCYYWRVRRLYGCENGCLLFNSKNEEKLSDAKIHELWNDAKTDEEIAAAKMRIYNYIRRG